MVPFGCANPGQIVEGPNHPGCTEIKACLAIWHSVFQGVSGPETLLIKMIERIAYNLSDSIRDFARVPSKRPKRQVTRLLKHSYTPRSYQLPLALVFNFLEANIARRRAPLRSTVPLGSEPTTLVEIAKARASGD